jgi:hypothetical protein
MFPQLDDVSIKRLRGFSKELRMQPGEIPFDPGDDSHGVFFILSGAVSRQRARPH